ncbi:hypothetical protein [Streptomyces sp. NPDC048462]|uniref:hypothetical protein n=1 Tax=Streptomyces sp. NPDC048462 TaxID=3365555 RepID=UPI00371F7A04
MHRRRGLLTCASVAGVLVLTGCGGGGEDSGSGDTKPASATSDSAGGTSASPASKDATSRTIGKSVYYAGFELTVKTMKYTPAKEPASAQVSLDMLFANQGPQPMPALGEMDLGSGDHHYPVSTGVDLPTVPGKAQSVTKLVFDVDEDFSADNAVLTVGDAGHVQSVLPLGGSGTAVTNEPRSVDVTTSVTAGPLKIQITDAQLRADLPKTYSQAESGKQELLLTFDATALSGAKALDYPVITGYDDFTLTEPNGNSIEAYGTNDTYGDAPTVNVDKGEVQHGGLAVFTIDKPSEEGAVYKLTVKHMLGDSKTPTGTGTFTLS